MLTSIIPITCSAENDEDVMITSVLARQGTRGSFGMTRWTVRAAINLQTVMSSDAINDYWYIAAAALAAAAAAAAAAPPQAKDLVVLTVCVLFGAGCLHL